MSPPALYNTCELKELFPEDSCTLARGASVIYSNRFVLVPDIFGGPGMLDHFFLQVVDPWHRLPRETADATSLETFKVRLEGALGNLIHLKMALLVAGQMD